MKYIEDMMDRFGKVHDLHMRLYGEGNNKRLTGIHETSSFSEFSYGTGNRAASFRIPTSTRADNGKGYVEDRRPASNIDPYIVGAIVFHSAVIDNNSADPMIKHYDAWIDFLSKTHIELA
jgi:glutamine synthetase